jgi:hydrogenase 3 maturation protease
MDATKTLKNSWKKPLSKRLRKSRRQAFVGVGQELRGDDAAGILAVRALEQALATVQAPAPFCYEAGPLPEASAGALRRFRPDTVTFLDAADLGEPPGAVRWIEPDEIGGFAGSTHTFPLGGFAQYLESELRCRVAVLGIQPEHLDFDAPVSARVQAAIKEIVKAILAETGATD